MYVRSSPIWSRRELYADSEQSANAGFDHRNATIMLPYHKGIPSMRLKEICVKKQNLIMQPTYWYGWMYAVFFLGGGQFAMDGIM